MPPTPGADLTSINGDLQQQGKALLDAVNGASFNGTNLLNGSNTGTLNFVSGYQSPRRRVRYDRRHRAGALCGTAAQTTTVDAPAITDGATVTTIQGLTDNSATVASASYGQDQIINGTTGTGTNPDTVTVTSVDINGVKTQTTYTALDTNGNATTVGSCRFVRRAGRDHVAGRFGPADTGRQQSDQPQRHDGQCQHR